MKKYQYSNPFSLACIAAAGNLGIMIPPSGSFVIYGFLTETPIGQLFIAGILPGIMIMILFCIQIYIQCRMTPQIGPAGIRTPWKERIRSLKDLWAIGMVFVLVMGGIYLGIFTPNEAAGVGVIAVILIALLARKLRWPGMIEALENSLKISAMIMFIIIGAGYFGSFLALSQLPNTLADFIAGLSVNRYLVIGLILLIYVICGFVMDVFAVLVITLPILFPVVKTLNFDPLHFGVMCVCTIMIASITPPFGIVVLALAKMFNENPWTVFRFATPFIITMVISLIFIIFIPEISVLLPNYMVPYR